MTVTPLREFGETFEAPTPPAQVAVPRHALGDLILSPSRAARLLRRAAVAAALLIGLAMLKVPIESLLAPTVYRKDFLQEYLLARAIAEGVDPYLPIPELATRFLGPLPVPLFPHPTPHPPTAGLLFLPLAFLDYPSAAILWVCLELACLAASVHLLGRIGGIRLGRAATLVAAAIALVWYAFLLDIVLGQLMLPILLLLAGAQCALTSGRRLLGGTLLGLSLLLKPVAWPVLLVFVMYRDWRALAAAFSTALLGYLMAAWVIGFGGVLAYLTQVVPAVTHLYQANPYNISAWTVGWRLFDGTRSGVLAGISAPPLVQSTPAAAAVSAALPALILLASLIAVRRQRSVARSLGLMICVSILVSPISWNHYLILAAIPAIEVGSWLIRHHLPPRETNLALVVAVLMLTGNEWTEWALAVAGAPDGATTIPFAPALLTLGPAVAVAALALVLVALPELPGRRPDYRPYSAPGDR
ncbi:MAG: glycosyltransferase family 87 protein [Chloroflexota bacterium]